MSRWGRAFHSKNHGLDGIVITLGSSGFCGAGIFTSVTTGTFWNIAIYRKSSMLYKRKTDITTKRTSIAIRWNGVVIGRKGHIHADVYNRIRDVHDGAEHNMVVGFKVRKTFTRCSLYETSVRSTKVKNERHVGVKKQGVYSMRYSIRL